MVVMAQLTVRLLGGHEVFTALGSPVDIRARKARALLAYMALQPGVPLRREQLATLLWGEFADARARASLRQTLKPTFAG